MLQLHACDCEGILVWNANVPLLKSIIVPLLSLWSKLSSADYEGSFWDARWWWFGIYNVGFQCEENKKEKENSFPWLVVFKFVFHGIK